MIIGIIYLVLALALGLSFTRWLQLAFTRIEALAVSLTVGLFGFSWLMVIPCLILPYQFALPLGCAATIVTTLVLISRGSTWSHRRLSRQATVVWVIFAIATAAFWGQLMFSHDLPLMAGNIVSGGSTWGDFGFHASIISHQAVAAKLPLDLPVASGVPLAYYFLIDFLSAHLDSRRLELQSGTCSARHVIGLVVNAATRELRLAALRSTRRRFSRSHFGTHPMVQRSA